LQQHSFLFLGLNFASVIKLDSINIYILVI
jgi:hypothetical protein